MFNYLCVFLLAAYFDKPTLTLPLLTLLVAQVTVTYALEGTVNYVPEIIRPILLAWTIFMLLS